MTNNINIGDIFWFNCDSSELKLEDYQCGVYSSATIDGFLVEGSETFVYCTFENINGDSNVCICLPQNLVLKYGKKI